jgi:branched-chain amino acid transport system substrate-binding protein
MPDLRSRGTRVAVAFAAVLAGAAWQAPAKADEAPFDIHVILSATGGASLYGQSVQRGLQLAEKVIAKEGGIHGRPVRFVVHDDETSPQVAVQLASQLIATQPPVILGPLLLAQCYAIAPLIQKGPLLYCLSPAINPEPGSYAFSAWVPSDGIYGAVLRYFQKRGWNRLAIIATSDATGQDSEKHVDKILSAPEFKGMTIIDREHFNPTDVSVAAHIENIRAAKPDALLGFTTGAPIGTVFKGMTQAGYDVPVGTSAGNTLYALMKQYQAILPKELYLAAGQGTARGDGLTLDPGTLAAKKKFTDALHEAGLQPDYGTEVVWDSSLILADALRHTMPNPTAASVKDYVMHLKHFAGTSGTYDFEKHPQRGLGLDAAVVVRWNAAQTMFEAVSQPGGEPIVR